LIGKEGGRRRKKIKSEKKMAESVPPQCIRCEIPSLREFGQG
jgi:hypothetical protein